MARVYNSKIILTGRQVVSLIAAMGSWYEAARIRPPLPGFNLVHRALSPMGRTCLCEYQTVLCLVRHLDPPVNRVQMVSGGQTGAHEAMKQLHAACH
eukprot:2584544-Amphidinium_carterae.1